MAPTNSTLQTPDPINILTASQTPTIRARLHATPILRILDRCTGDLVGWVYEWNNGERCNAWMHGKHDDVVYE